jgi:hypothetical protein
VLTWYAASRMEERRRTAKTALSVDISFLSFSRLSSSLVGPTSRFPKAVFVPDAAMPVPFSPLCNRSLHRIDDVYDHPAVLRRVKIWV